MILQPIACKAIALPIELSPHIYLVIVPLSTTYRVLLPKLSYLLLARVERNARSPAVLETVILLLNYTLIW